jgi:hypothetical protein
MGCRVVGKDGEKEVSSEKKKVKMSVIAAVNQVENAI